MIANLLAQTTQSLAGPNVWLPPGASTIAGETDWLLNFILGVTIVFSLLIFFLMVAFVIKYRHKPGHAPVPSAGHSTALELTWTIIPTILVVIIFFYGFRQYLNMVVIPPNTYEVRAEGFMWGWSFVYPNGYSDPNLHVPAGTPVRVVLTSRDVIHALYIPALRVQKMNTPGRYNRIWFQPEWVHKELVNQPYTNPVTGKAEPYTEQHDIYCNMYCGTSHSDMRATLYVHRPEDFPAWLADASDWIKRGMKPVDRGAELHKGAGCASCHTVDGSKNTGPTWKDLWGKQGTYDKGKPYTADDNYLRESILYSDKHIVDGFTPAMPIYAGQLKDEDVNAIITYMKSISSHWDGGDPNTGFPYPPGKGPGATSAPATQPAK